MVIEPIRIEKAVITEETISVKLFSEKIGKPVSEILKTAAARDDVYHQFSDRL